MEKSGTGFLKGHSYHQTSSVEAQKEIQLTSNRKK